MFMRIHFRAWSQVHHTSMCTLFPKATPGQAISPVALLPQRASRNQASSLSCVLLLSPLSPSSSPLPPCTPALLDHTLTHPPPSARKHGAARLGSRDITSSCPLQAYSVPGTRHGESGEGTREREQADCDCDRPASWMCARWYNIIYGHSLPRARSQLSRAASAAGSGCRRPRAPSRPCPARRRSRCRRAAPPPRAPARPSCA